MSNPIQFYQLPTELLVRVISLLETKSIALLSLSSRQFYFICTQPIYIRNITILSYESLYSRSVGQDRTLLPYNIIQQDTLGTRHFWRLLDGETQYSLRKQQYWDIPDFPHFSEWNDWEWGEGDPIDLELEKFDPAKIYEESVERGKQRLEKLFKNQPPRRRRNRKKILGMAILKLIEDNEKEKEKEREREREKEKEREKERENALLFPEEYEKGKKIFEEAAIVAKMRQFLKLNSPVKLRHNNSAKGAKIHATVSQGRLTSQRRNSQELRNTERLESEEDSPEKLKRRSRGPKGSFFDSFSRGRSKELDTEKLRSPRGSPRKTKKEEFSPRGSSKSGTPRSGSLVRQESKKRRRTPITRGSFSA